MQGSRTRGASPGPGPATGLAPTPARTGPRPDADRDVGLGWAPAHHGELLQGVFVDRGRPRRALVTLPLPGRGSHAVFRPAPGRSGVTVEPADRVKARRAGELALAWCHRHGAADARVHGGRLRLSGDVPPGHGLGSSTSDVVAAIRAVTDYHRLRPRPDQVADLAVRAERASDATMIDGVVLFAHRDGVVLERLADALPPITVVGCQTAQAQTGVDTLALAPPAYTDGDVARFRVLLAALRRALRDGDVALLGRVATASALINQRFLPTPRLDTVRAVATRTGAAGVQVAHSGTVVGLLFDTGAADLDHRVERCRAALADEGLRCTGTWRVGR